MFGLNSLPAKSARFFCNLRLLLISEMSLTLLINQTPKMSGSISMNITVANAAIRRSSSMLMPPLALSAYCVVAHKRQLWNAQATGLPGSILGLMRIEAQARAREAPRVPKRLNFANPGTPSGPIRSSHQPAHPTHKRIASFCALVNCLCCHSGVGRDPEQDCFARSGRRASDNARRPN